MAETKAAADTAFDYLAESCLVKYPAAVKRLTNGRADLLAFYDFPDGRALEACTDIKADLEHLCHGQAPNHQN